MSSNETKKTEVLPDGTRTTGCICGYRDAALCLSSRVDKARDANDDPFADLHEDDACGCACHDECTYHGGLVDRCEDCGCHDCERQIEEDAIKCTYHGCECADCLRRLDADGAETQASISQWARATFGEVGSNISVATRANEEMAELLRHLAKSDSHEKAGEECADIVIILYRLADRLGVDLMAEVDRKMAINRAREWVLDGHGHGQHKPSGGDGP